MICCWGPRIASDNQELQAATGLASLWQQQGKRGEADELPAGVYSWFTGGFDTPDRKDARALLKEISATAALASHQVGLRSPLACH